MPPPRRMQGDDRRTRCSKRAHRPHPVEPCRQLVRTAHIVRKILIPAEMQSPLGRNPHHAHTAGDGRQEAGITAWSSCSETCPNVRAHPIDQLHLATTLCRASSSASMHSRAAAMSQTPSSRFLGRFGPPSDDEGRQYEHADLRSDSSVYLWDPQHLSRPDVGLRQMVFAHDGGHLLRCPDVRPAHPLRNLPQRVSWLDHVPNR